LRYIRVTALLVICVLMTASQHASAQHDAQGSQQTASESSRATSGTYATSGLRILVLEGQNVVNSIPTRTAVSPVIQVLDVVNQPVEGASVTFEVSPTGPGGLFGQQPIITTRTDSVGQATAVLTPNDIPGPFVIKVTASFQGQTKEARIRQTNDAKVLEAMLPLPPRPWYKSWKRWALIGAAAGGTVAAIAILSKSDPTVTISPGTVVVGGQ
jgi:hypothetical protein